MRNDILRRAAREHRVEETGLASAGERAPRWLERLGFARHRSRALLEAAVLDAALRERVVVMGRWSTLVPAGLRHVVRVRVCAPLPARARRVMERDGVARAEAERRIIACGEGVRPRIRRALGVEPDDPTWGWTGRP